MPINLPSGGPPPGPGPGGPPPGVGGPPPGLGGLGGQKQPTIEDLNNVISNVAEELPPEAIQMLIKTLQQKLVEKTRGREAGGGGPGLRDAAAARTGGGPGGGPGGPPPGMA